MEDEYCRFLDWEIYNQEEGLDKLRHSFLYTTLELEATIVSAQEEIAKRECELINLSNLLSKVTGERDEAQEKYQKLLAEKQNNQEEWGKKQRETANAITQGTRNCGSEGESKSEVISILTHLKRPLPEKGKLLQAVVEAGPLLQTLLLAGPLPQWQHPPPKLVPVDIPPVSPTPKPNSNTNSLPLHQDSSIDVSPSFRNKRGSMFCEATDYSPETKHQKVI